MTRIPLLPQDFEPEIPSTSHPPVNPLLLVVALLLILFVASSALAYNFYRQSRGLPVPSISPTPEVPSPTSIDPSIAPTPTLPTAESIVWISPPKTIAPLDIFKPDVEENESYTLSKARYYKVADIPGNKQLYVAFIPTHEMGDYYTILRVVQDNNKFYLVTTSNENSGGDFYGLLDKQKISIWPYQLAELNLPEILYPKDQQKVSLFKKTYPTDLDFNGLKDPVLLEEFSTGSLYYTKAPAESRPLGIYGLNYYFRLRDNTLFKYVPDIPSFSDDQKPSITWSDGTVNSTAFNTRLNIGCGQGSMNDNYVLSPEFISSKIQAGFMHNQKTPEYEVFQVVDPSHPLVKTLYENYKIGRESESGLLNINDFASKRNHFIWKDKMGNYLLFISTEFQPMAECGKPVIYLYPHRETQVVVRVGASITQSEPSYPISGWKVTAKTNGQLTYQGSTYPYLFWEGQGVGFYPDYRNRGTLVKQFELISTLTFHLRQLGLNDRETADFLEFWQPRLPSTPYVRLTWLTTPDMNRLAPLLVSPKPDTTIRIFLEFEGLNSPVSLKPQTLSAPARRGFTLIEWGGLLVK